MNWGKKIKTKERREQLNPITGFEPTRPLKGGTREYLRRKTNMALMGKTPLP